MRWWREFRNPALKCERLGHAMRDVAFSGYCLPGRNGLSYYYHAVAVRVKVTFHVCRRCKWEDTAKKKIEDHGSIQRLGMSSSDWRELEETGFLLHSDG